MDNAGALIGMVLYLAVIVLVIASIWVVYTKANEPGWAAIIPIYNLVVLLKITGKPVWWIVLFLLGPVAFIAAILVYISLAKSFGKGAGFGIGMLLLPFVFLPMLAFGDAKYQGPAG